jgi:hypothetical protein
VSTHVVERRERSILLANNQNGLPDALPDEEIVRIWDLLCSARDMPRPSKDLLALEFEPCRISVVRMRAATRADFPRQIFFNAPTDFAHVPPFRFSVMLMFAHTDAMSRWFHRKGHIVKRRFASREWLPLREISGSLARVARRTGHFDLATCHEPREGLTLHRHQAGKDGSLAQPTWCSPWSPNV